LKDGERERERDETQAVEREIIGNGKAVVRAETMTAD
jgi:hypothetical protein